MRVTVKDLTVHKQMTETPMDRASMKHTGAEPVSVVPGSAGRETGGEGERVRGVSERCWTDGWMLVWTPGPAGPLTEDLPVTSVQALAHNTDHVDHFHCVTPSRPFSRWARVS